MKIKDIYKILDEISPFELQESWDNSGIIIGDREDEFENLYLSLDIDSTTIENMKENSLVITHHPLIFNPLKTFNTQIYPANIIKTMIEKQIYLISMHTNFDQTHFTKYIVKNILKKEVIKIEQKYLHYFEVNTTFDEFLKDIKTKFNLKNPNTVISNKNFIKNAAILNGSGADFIPHINDADCFITGDIKYHQALEAKEKNLSLIDIGHYESEIFFSKCLQNELQKYSISAIITDSKNPFTK